MRMQQMIALARTIYAVLLLLMIAGCGAHSEHLQDGTEAASLPAPDGLSRAFVWVPKSSDTLGATNSQSYEVWIQYSKGDKQPSLVLRADATDGLIVDWKGPQQLEICYGPSHIYYFNNLFDRADQYARQLYRVEIVLRHVQALAACK